MTAPVAIATRPRAGPFRRLVWAAWAVGLVLLAWISLEPRFAPPGGSGGALAPDKLLHVLAYALFAAFPALAGIGRRRALAIGLALVVLGALLELAQRYLPGRRFGWDDMLANVVGAAIGAAVAAAADALARRRRGKDGS
ncbi:MAG: VanZ family protein [Alphaproteobacteria bacterium]